MTNQQKTSLSVLTFGAGAIGTYIGGSLALKGHKVVFLDQPEAAEKIRQHGLRLKLKEKEKEIDGPLAAGSVEQAFALGPFDIVIMALKSFDTQDAAAGLIPYREVIPPILSLQNGVDNEAILAAAVGPENVVAGTVTSAIGRRGPGEIILHRLRGMGIGAEHPIAPRLLEAFNDAGLNARLYRHSADMKWSKMVTNLIGNASSAILDMNPAEIFEHPGLYRMEINQLREALKVMDAQRIQVVDLPGTPIRALTFAIRSLPLALSHTLLKNLVGGGRGGKMPSFHIDLHSGRGKSEVAFLNGAVARYGEHYGVPTPVNNLLNSTLIALTNGEIPLDTYAHQPEKLLEQLEAVQHFNLSR